MKNNQDIFTPTKLSEFFGQNEHIKVLKTAVSVAKNKNSVIDHTLIYGNSGLGKTTLAKIVSNELGANFIYVSAPSITSSVELISIITNIKAGDVLFIDEVHRISKKFEEILYTVMENFKLSFIYNSDEKSKTVVVDLPRFTLIAATTMIYDISTPLRNRFPLIIKLEDYSVESMEVLASKMFKKAKLQIEKDALTLIASRSRKNPRILKNNIKRIIDFMEYKNLVSIDYKDTLEVFKMLKIYEDGLLKIDINILKTMVVKLNNRPVGMESVALMMGESKEEIVYVQEPFLVENGYIIRTKRGRIVSEKGLKYLKNISL